LAVAADASEAPDDECGDDSDDDVDRSDVDSDAAADVINNECYVLLAVHK
jgi:hypothetical protein